TGHPRVIDLTQDGLTCPKDVAWSPDGATVAVLGYQLGQPSGSQPNCPSTSLNGYAYLPGQIDTYSVASGALVARILPDDAIAQELHFAPPVGATPTTHFADVSHQIILYLHVLWSPDSKTLAVSFATNGDTTRYFDGVVLTDAAGTHSRVLSYGGGLSTSGQYSGEWNVMTGAYIPVPANTPPGNWQPVPAALRYAWSTDDTLAAQGPPLSSASVPPAPSLGPIGNPDGGSSFTIWQPEAVMPVANTNNLYLFGPAFAAWSPDGSRLILRINVFGVLSTDPSSPPSADVLASQRLTEAALFPLRDKGLVNGLADVRSSRAGSNTDSVPVLWRPDGRAVAVVTQPIASPDNPTTAEPSVRIYDCASGKLLGTVREQISSTSAGTAANVSWSADGTHLLMLDSSNLDVIIWGPGQLPSA
ncbi:MAG: hypothetical protein ACRDHP_07475, partial [Ktedonobacterales bacterium]